MYEVGNTYKTNMQNGKYDPERTITGTITLTNGTILPIDNSVIKTNTLNINNQCASNSLELGSTNIGQCSFEYNTDLYIYDLYDAEIVLIYHAWGEDIPIGTFYVSGATRQTNNWLKITGYDAMSKFDDNIGNFSTNGNAYAVLSWLCRMVGVELSNTQEEIEAMENSSTILNISSNSYTTYKEALKDVAMVLGGFATIDRYGKLKIAKYTADVTTILTQRELISASVSEYDTYITEINITVDGITYKATTSTNDGLIYSLSNKMIKGLVATIQPIVDNILDAVKDVKYTPATYTIMYDPIYDLGDLIELNPDGKVIKKKIRTIITGVSFTFQGSSQIKGVGESIFLSRRGKNSQAAATDSATAYAKNNGTYIETYENIESYEIGTTRKNVVTIEYGNGESDVVVLHGQACINCTTEGTVQFIYGKDGVDETFSPKHKLQPGYNTVEFYCYYLEPEQNWMSMYTVDLVSEDAEGTIAIGDIRAHVLATMYGAGKFMINNVFDESIPYYNRDDTLNNYIIGTEDPYQEDEE